jgi:hypothetical protein
MSANFVFLNSLIRPYIRPYLYGLMSIFITPICKVIMNLIYSHHFANSTVILMTLFAITSYHWPKYWMICFIECVRLSFPYWLWRRVIQYTLFRLRAHSVCDRSTEDAYYSAAPDPIFAFVGGPWCPTFDFVIALWIMIAFYTLLTLLFCIWKHMPSGF